MVPWLLPEGISKQKEEEKKDLLPMQLELCYPAERATPISGIRIQRFLSQ